jgi:hypothetical protein
MSKLSEENKMFNMRMSKEMWMFLKLRAAEQEEAMTDIVNRLLEKYKKKFDDKLTKKDINV